VSDQPLFPTDRLFAWYDRHGRDLPWRRRWPVLAPAYHVWLSEIMLQQTVVTTVIPYFLDFTRRWPDVHALAVAPLDDVLAAWAGLGYYARARNLHKAAQVISSAHDGQVPDDPDALRALPGVGAYTAGAIAAIAHGRQAVVVDGNIERLFARFYAIETPLPGAKSEIAARYQDLLPVARPSDFPQALMDFANAVCTPKQPGCTGCAFAATCLGFARGVAARLPVKPAKKAKPVRQAIAYVAFNLRDEVFLETRPQKGLFGGLLAFPETGLAARGDEDAGPQAGPPFRAAWVTVGPPVRHVFTHFIVEMEVRVARISDGQAHLSGRAGRWHTPRPGALPSLMRKVWHVATDSGYFDRGVAAP
jgi:A/G-specific adenine glycosylase